MILFCECGSDGVHVKRWDKGRALFECGSCGRSSWVEGFTLSRFSFMEYLTGALLDQARKHRQRDPEKVRQEMSARELKRHAEQARR